MDPYSILGIRPSASQTEIELAYKGRRSQYHPDRYATEDEETVTWATAMMKQVNEAYAVLSDPEVKARFDRQRRQGRGKEDSPKPNKASASRPPPNVREYLLRHLPTRPGNDRAYVAPDIPHKKLHSAIASYGYGLKPEEVVLLVDDTVFGSGKDGMLVASAEVRIKEAFQDHERIPFSAIQKIHSGGNRLNINGRQVLKFAMTDAGEMSCLIAGLNEFLGDIRLSKSPDDEIHDESEEEEEELQELDRIVEELRDRVRSEQDPQARARLALCGDVIIVTGLLSEMLEGVDADLDESDEEALDSDIVRLEILAYAYSRCARILDNRTGTAEASTFLDTFGECVLTTYCIEMESLDELSHLRGRERLKHSLLKSRLFAEISIRTMGYSGLGDDRIESAETLTSSLRSPAFRLIYPKSMAEQIEGAMEELVDDFFDIETTCFVLAAIDYEMDKAVKRYMDVAHGDE